MNRRAFPYLALSLGVATLAFSPIFVTLADVNGLVATFYRTSVAAIVLIFPFLLRRDNRLGTSTTRPGVRLTVMIAGLGGLLFALNNGFFNTAVTMIPASSAVFLANTSVIWVGIISMVVLHEKLALNFWVGVFLALAGVFLITSGGSDNSISLTRGSIIALTGGFFYGLYILFNSTARSYLNSLSYMVLSNTASSLMLFAVLLIAGIPFTGFTPATYGYLFALGFVSQAVGFLSIVYAQSYLAPSRVSTILLVQPPLVLILSFFILRQKPSILQLIGMFILFIGIFLANRRNTSNKILPLQAD